MQYAGIMKISTAVRRLAKYFSIYHFVFMLIESNFLNEMKTS